MNFIQILNLQQLQFHQFYSKGLKISWESQIISVLLPQQDDQFTQQHKVFCSLLTQNTNGQMTFSDFNYLIFQILQLNTYCQDSIQLTNLMLKTFDLVAKQNLISLQDYDLAMSVLAAFLIIQRELGASQCVSYQLFVKINSLMKPLSIDCEDVDAAFSKFDRIQLSPEAVFSFYFKQLSAKFLQLPQIEPCQPKSRRQTPKRKAPPKQQNQESKGGASQYLPDKSQQSQNIENPKKQSLYYLNEPLPELRKQTSPYRNFKNNNVAKNGPFNSRSPQTFNAIIPLPNPPKPQINVPQRFKNAKPRNSPKLWLEPEQLQSINAQVKVQQNKNIKVEKLTAQQEWKLQQQEYYRREMLAEQQRKFEKMQQIRQTRAESKLQYQQKLLKLETTLSTMRKPGFSPGYESTLTKRLQLDKPVRQLALLSVLETKHHQLQMLKDSDVHQLDLQATQQYERFDQVEPDSSQ